MGVIWFKGLLKHLPIRAASGISRGKFHYKQESTTHGPYHTHE